LGAFGLPSGNRTECCEESWIDGSPFVEEGADDVLDVFDGLGLGGLMYRRPPSEYVHRIEWEHSDMVDVVGKQVLLVETCGVPWGYKLAC
jgi:hypothetical protein